MLGTNSNQDAFGNKNWEITLKSYSLIKIGRIDWKTSLYLRPKVRLAKNTKQKRWEGGTKAKLANV